MSGKIAPAFQVSDLGVSVPGRQLVGYPVGVGGPIQDDFEAEPLDQLFDQRPIVLGPPASGLRHRPELDGGRVQQQCAADAARG